VATRAWPLGHGQCVCVRACLHACVRPGQSHAQMGKPCITSVVQQQLAQLQGPAALGHTLGCASICDLTPGNDGTRVTCTWCLQCRWMHASGSAAVMSLFCYVPDMCNGRPKPCQHPDWCVPTQMSNAWQGRDATTADWFACMLAMSANMLTLAGVLAVKRILPLMQFIAMEMVSRVCWL